jgi:hypothetical protein
MTLNKMQNGFSICEDKICFEFECEAALSECNGIYTTVAVGDIPTPKLCDGDRILLPMGEGIALTVGEQQLITTAFGDFCSKQGTLCMAVLQRGGKYLLISLENGIYSAYDTRPEDGRYKLRMYTKDGNACKVSYGVFDTLKDACAYHRDTHGAITLDEKIAGNKEIEKLVGGGIFWVWNNRYDDVMYSDHDVDIDPSTGDDLMRIADDLYQSGIKKAMMGIFFEPDSGYVEPLYKKYGYISTQYDNYNDVLNPEMLSIVPNNRARNCDYTARRMKDYPNGVQVKPDGELAKAWALKGFDGVMHHQNTLCPAVAAERIKEEIPQILKKYPYYKGRFIDVYGCRLGACYSPVHPLTMAQSLVVKNGAFEAMEKMGLITGTENGFDGIVDHMVYSEGLHSPVNLQIPDAGRKHAHVMNEEQQAHTGREMMRPERRVPLWQLVYHDCMMTFPYWGDSTESSPMYTNRKVLFACLFGCPPLYSFSVKDYEMLKPAILDSYQRISEVHEKVATLKMTDYKVLSDDYMLQRTEFGGKYAVIANFGDTEKEFEGRKIAPESVIFEQIC